MVCNEILLLMSAVAALPYVAEAAVDWVRQKITP